MADLLAVFFIIPLLGCLFVLFSKKNDFNSFNVAFFSLCANILVILKLFTDLKFLGHDFFCTYQWLNHPHIQFTFGIDYFSLLLLLGIYISVVIGLSGLTDFQRKSKSFMMLVLFFTWNISGLLITRDIVSFYLFFAGMQIPLFMLIGTYGNVRKSSALSLFFLFNLVGSLFLLLAIMIIYRYNHGSILLSEINVLNISKRAQFIVLGSTCLSFVLRIPVWPLHNWISYLCTGIKNPLIYVITSLIPLTGLYGFIRLGNIIIANNGNLTLIIKTCCVLTMIFITLIGLSHKTFLQKLFSYSSIYYLFFLLARLLLEDKYQMNMAYSLFIFLIVNASLSVFDFLAEKTSETSGLPYKGILGYTPRLAILFTFFVLIAIGLPISSMFWNNFVLISALFRENFATGVWIMSTISIIGLALIYELYIMHDIQYKNANSYEIADISDRKLFFFTGITILLFLSFFNPLWFVL